jgi:alkylation response protein AidB-like acyl-CoA dehydrogenase
MGFIEETGAAQHFRDARITPIYEGTNGIQAADLVTRKLGMENGGVLLGLLGDIERDAAEVPALAGLADECAQVARWMIADASLDNRLAGSVAFLTMCSVAVAGWQLLRQVRAVATGEAPGNLALTKPVTARFFFDHIVPEASGLRAAASAGAASLYALEAEVLAG